MNETYGLIPGKRQYLKYGQAHMDKQYVFFLTNSNLYFYAIMVYFSPSLFHIQRFVDPGYSLSSLDGIKNKHPFSLYGLRVRT